MHITKVPLEDWAFVNYAMKFEDTKPNKLIKPVVDMQYKLTIGG